MCAAKSDENNSEREIEDFLRRWMPLPGDISEGCPPYSVLEEAAKEPTYTVESDPDLQTHSAKEPNWNQHFAKCDHCRNMIALLKETERPQVTLQDIFAKASRDAQKVKSRKRSALGVPSVLGGFEHSFFWAKSRSAIAFAASMILIVGFWIAGRQFNLFKTSDNVATVTFERNESKEVLQSVNVKVAKLEQTPVKEQEQDDYIADYNKTGQYIISLNQQKKIPKEDRTDIAVAMARYRSELEKQIRNNREVARNSAKRSSSIQSEPDTAAVLSLYSNVNQAVSKKNENVSSPTNQIPDSSVIKEWSEQLRVEFNNSDADVSVQDKLPNRPKEEADALVKGVQTFATQNGRTVNLKIGSGTLTITPTTSFTSRPKE
ncbi:MAG TPA: hypothetical protein VJ875_26875 [Pyrinomonadaceae bacterium]|nr:hypothetical protein [Pyrinomonadaceae bacterium]